MTQKNLLGVMVFMMIPGCYQSTPATSDAWGDPSEIFREQGAEDFRYDAVPDRDSVTDFHESIPDAPPEGEPLCGNGALDPGEECDDRNDVPGDGCDNDCTYSCVGNDDCVYGERCDVVLHLCLPCGDESCCEPMTETVTVTANPLWTDTGIDGRSMDTLKIHGAAGTWSWAQSVGPDGGPADLMWDEWITNDRHGQLIGFVGDDPHRVGQNDPGLFAVGSGTITLVRQPGRLWLGINDDFASGGIGDNWGSLSVLVDVNLPDGPGACPWGEVCGCDDEACHCEWDMPGCDPSIPGPCRDGYACACGPALCECVAE